KNRPFGTRPVRRRKDTARGRGRIAGGLWAGVSRVLRARRPNRGFAVVRRRQADATRRHCASGPILVGVSGKATMKTTVRHDEFMRERLADAEFSAGYLHAGVSERGTPRGVRPPH